MKVVSGEMNYGPICVRSVVLKFNSRESDPISGFRKGVVALREEFITALLKTTGSPADRFSLTCNGSCMP